MFVSNLKIALRNLNKRKQYTFINVLGLSVGITSCLIILLYVQYELSYDKSFADVDRIYKLVLERKYPDQTKIVPFVPHSFASVVVKDYAEIEKATTLCGPFEDMMISYKGSDAVDLKFLENDVYLADSNFFKIFSFRMIRGDRNSALVKPGSMVLTESAARRHFGKEDPIGKMITMSREDHVVTGVCEDPPPNTQFKFALLVSINTVERFNLDNFARPDAHCYVRLTPEGDANSLEAKFPKMVDTYAGAEIERLNKISWTAYQKAGNGYRYFLRPLTDVYLDPDNVGGMKAGGNIIAVKVMIAIAVLIFIIACINFMNLALARSTERAKEVGVRKVMGSYKRQIIFQFLTESFVLSFIGVACAALLVAVLFPYFNMLIGTHIQPGFGILTAVGLVVLVFFISLLAGIYPSFVLSSFSPVLVLKGNSKTTHGGRWLRNALVVFQFWISTTLIICILVMQQQMKFIGEKHLGYDKEQLLVIEGDFHMKPEFTRAFTAEISRLPEVVSAAGSLSMPSIGGIYEKQYHGEGNSEILTMHAMYVGDHYSELMKFTLLNGKLFSEESHDSLSVLLNESAVKAMGIKDPIGKKLIFIEQTYGTGEETAFTIQGVVKDFHFRSLHQDIQPLVIHSNEIIFGRMAYIVARIKAGASREAVTKLESKWKEMASGTPFQFRFLDQVLNDHYLKEQRVAKIFFLFSGLSVLVACIGLFGMSTYNANLRTKEIGIRKVIGAGISDILVLLSGEITRIVLISFALAIPVAWYVMENWWLQDFAFRIQIEMGTFLTSGAVALLIAWSTVGYQTLKAALQNPANALRNQ